MKKKFENTIIATIGEVYDELGPAVYIELTSSKRRGLLG